MSQTRKEVGAKGGETKETQQTNKTKIYENIINKMDMSLLKVKISCWYSFHRHGNIQQTPSPHQGGLVCLTHLVRSECLTCTFRASCCSARLSRAQVQAVAGSSVRDRKKKRGEGVRGDRLHWRVQGNTSSPTRISSRRRVVWGVMEFGMSRRIKPKEKYVRVSMKGIWRKLTVCQKIKNCGAT